MPKSKTRRIVKALIILDVLIYNVILLVAIKAAGNHPEIIFPIMCLLTIACAFAVYSFYWTDYPEQDQQRKHRGSYNG